MRSLRRAALAAAIGLSALAAPRMARAEQPKLIVVDLRRAVLDTEEGLRVQASLKRLFDVRQRSLNDLQRQFQQKQQTVQAKVQGGTPQAQLTKELEDLQHLYVDITTRQNEYTNEMSAREQQLTAPILNRIVSLIQKIAATEGAALIVDKSVVPYYRADLEVTDRAIQMFNNGEVGLSGPGAPIVKPPAAPAAPTPGAAPPAPKK